MLNHRPNEPVTWSVSETHISFHTANTLPANTEVHNNYGAKGNEERIPSYSSVPNTVLLGYGFCVPGNPHDSVSIRLPGDTQLYMITRSNLLPDDLFSKFCVGREGRGRLVRGYISYLRALRQKLLTIGFDVRVCDTPAGKQARIYRDSQRDVLLRAFSYVVGLIRQTGMGAEISSKTILRSQDEKKRKGDQDVDLLMVEWLVCRLKGEVTEEEIPEKFSDYINRLSQYYREQPVDEDDDESEEMETECRRIRKRLKRKGLEVKAEMVKLAMRMWDRESVEIIHFPDVLELFEESQDTVALAEALTGESIDIVMFIDAIP